MTTKTKKSAQEPIMTTKTKKSAQEPIMTTKTKKSPKVASRTWNQTYEFVKSLKVEPAKDTISGAVYAGIKKLGKGTIEQATEAAMRAGLGDVTDQDPRVQTQVHLRRLMTAGAVKQIRHQKLATDKPKTKSSSKSKRTKKVVLKKKASDAPAATA